MCYLKGYAAIQKRSCGNLVIHDFKCKLDKEEKLAAGIQSFEEKTKKVSWV